MGIRPSAKAEYSLSVIPFSHDIVFADLDRLIQNERKNLKEKSSKVKSFDGRVGCQAQCTKGLPRPSNYCVPDASAPPPAPPPATPTFYTVATPVVTSIYSGMSSSVTVASTTVQARCDTPGATMRYTLDGSRPLASSPVFPSQGVAVHRATSVVVKAFAPGLVESAAAGGVFSAASDHVY